ncbi:SET domain-containing protein [Trametes meyenii]|nr:SET domain-containing protein [Trametes meyenii]
MADLDKQRWERLLKWLSQKHGMDTDSLRVEPKEIPGAGRGLVATETIPPSAMLFKVPAAALMNVKTMSPLYPNIRPGKLSGIQLVSMHLLLHKPAGDNDSLDDAFGPYMSTLPRDFSSHPLSWFVRRQLGTEDPRTSYLLDHIPPGTWQSVIKLSERFWKDWEAVADVVKDSPSVLARSTRQELRAAKGIETERLLLDYLWAWLNVNTRCIFYRTRHRRSDPDNFTLCPILDFANHGVGRTQIFPVINSEAWGAPAPLAKAEPYAFFGSSDQTVAKGEELLLKYGSHSNNFLFTEYGFVNALSEGSVLNGDQSGEVDVQDLVEELLEKAGPAKDAIKKTLECSQYWGEWTLDRSSTSAAPSWRLIAALRLICALEGLSENATLGQDMAIQSWKDVTNGIRNQISPENETKWRGTLTRMCEVLRDRARENVVALGTVQSPQDGPGWLHWMQDNVRTLWREQSEVAKAVLAGLHAGEEF